MDVYRSDDVLESPAADRLRQFVRDHRQKWDAGVPDFETFEQALHEQMMALERACLSADRSW